VSQTKVLSLGISLLLFCLVGCSSLHVKVDPNTKWGEVSTVTLLGPQQDPWRLRPAILAELQEMGLTVLPGEGSRPDLEVRFFFQQGRDINEEGHLLNRLQSIHIQLAEPGTETFVAVADYFYANNSITKPEMGVTAAFAQLRQDIHPDSSPRVPSAQKNQSPKKMMTTDKSNDPSAAQSGGTSQDDGRDEQGVAAESALPVETIVPVTDNSSPEKSVQSKTRSPWTPRFKSWGFEEWGKESNDDL